jgi:hypothetical protein
MQTPAEIPIMLQEMATVGGTMTIVILFIWLIMVALSLKIPQLQKTKN